jgi:Glycosyl hydrolases family 25
LEIYLRIREVSFLRPYFSVLALSCAVVFAGAFDGVAATCVPQTSSSSLAFKSERNGDVGVISSGFVLPADSSAVVNGIDVSKYQTDPIFAGVRDCGGVFAYVRLSAGTVENNELAYRTFWANAKSAGLPTGPYHHLTLTDVKSPLHQLGKADLDALIDKNQSQATFEAQLFKKRLLELLSYDALAEQAPGTYGAPYLPAALDITETPQAKNSPADQQQFAPIYGAAICAWVKEFQSDDRFKDQPVVLFTKPFIFRDYQLASAPCDLSRFKIWISYHGPGGDRPLTEKDPVEHKAIEDLCLTPGKENRCLFEQYTSYGGFAVFTSNGALDLDRYIGTLDSLNAELQRARAGPEK